MGFSRIHFQSIHAALCLTRTYDDATYIHKECWQSRHTYNLYIRRGTTCMHAYTLTNLIYKQEEHNIMVSMSILYSWPFIQVPSELFAARLSQHSFNWQHIIVFGACSWAQVFGEPLGLNRCETSPDFLLRDASVLSLS